VWLANAARPDPDAVVAGLNPAAATTQRGQLRVKGRWSKSLAGGADLLPVNAQVRTYPGAWANSRRPGTIILLPLRFYGTTAFGYSAAR
jgi:hypothetical protein